MPKITKRLVEAAEAREKDYIICDDELRGFAVRVLPSGKRYYIVQYRINTRYRRMSLGQHGVLTTEKARTKAFGLLAAVKDGKDPAGDRRERRHALTVAELAQRFDKEHIAIRLKPGTARKYRREPPPFHPAGDRQAEGGRRDQGRYCPTPPRTPSHTLPGQP
jgi:Arm DNA-binding domain